LGAQIRYVFEDILGIRKVREDRASRECTVRRAAMEQAYAYVDQCQAELEQYRVWRVEEKDRLYAQVINQEVIMRDLDELKALLAALDEKEALYLRRLQVAEADAEEAKKAYEQAVREWRQSQANLHKMEEHKDVWMEEALVEAAHAEELEMEEHITKRLGGLGEELDH